jgi:hypothetical protein
MTDNPNSDAERLKILRINHPTEHASPTCATCFLLAQIDTRDADLRDKDAENNRLRTDIEKMAIERITLLAECGEARQTIARLRATFIDREYEG